MTCEKGEWREEGKGGKKRSRDRNRDRERQKQRQRQTETETETDRISSLPPTQNTRRKDNPFPISLPTYLADKAINIFAQIAVRFLKF